MDLEYILKKWTWSISKKRWTRTISWRSGPGVYLEKMTWSISRRGGPGVYLEEMDWSMFRIGGPGLYLEEMDWSMFRIGGPGLYLEWYWRWYPKDIYLLAETWRGISFSTKGIGPWIKYYTPILILIQKICLRFQIKSFYLINVSKPN